MPGSGRTVYIAGAGIAGLTLALGLAKFGNRVVVLERNERIQEAGAGLQVSPNARRVLDQLGLGPQIAAHSFRPLGIDVFPLGARKPLVTLELGDVMRERYGASYSVMHRADLAEILFRACRRFANIDIAFDVPAFSVAADERGLAVTADARSGQSSSGRAFAFAGADGVNSYTRTALLAGPQALASGFVAWRTTLPLDALGGVVSLDRTSLLFASGAHAVCYPLPHRQALNVVLLAPAPKQRHPKDPPANPEASRAYARSAQLSAILDAARDTWTYWPMSTVDTATWHQGAVGLLGDAVHAMLPFQAQGAAMAIEDAAILAPLLMAEPTAEAAFARFAQLRRDRIARVARVSRANGAAFHMNWPMTLGRDLVLAAGGTRGHLKRLDWLYGFEAVPEPGTTPAGR